MRLILIYACVAFLIGCETTDIAREDDFKESKQAFSLFKNEQKNTYRYITSGSSWAGTSWKTEITINDGKVKARKFYYTNYSGITRPNWWLD